MTLRAVLVLLATSAALGAELQLTYAKTGKPLAGVAVRVWSDNGIRCVRAPCPTNGKEWKGTTDSKGVVDVPASAFQEVTDLAVDGYRGAQLSRDLAKPKSGGKAPPVTRLSLTRVR